MKIKVKLREQGHGGNPPLTADLLKKEGASVSLIIPHSVLWVLDSAFLQLSI